jgi:hypothetical protein
MRDDNVNIHIKLENFELSFLAGDIQSYEIDKSSDDGDLFLLLNFKNGSFIKLLCNTQVCIDMINAL